MTEKIKGTLRLVKFPGVDFFMLSLIHDGTEEVVARGDARFVAHCMAEAGLASEESLLLLLAMAPPEGGGLDLGEVTAEPREPVPAG